MRPPLSLCSSLSLIDGAGRISDLFRALDRDGDGLVTKREFGVALPLLGYDSSCAALLDEVFDQLDVDGTAGGEAKPATAAAMAPRWPRRPPRPSDAPRSSVG